MNRKTMAIKFNFNRLHLIFAYLPTIVTRKVLFIIWLFLGNIVPALAAENGARPSILTADGTQQQRLQAERRKPSISFIVKITSDASEPNKLALLAKLPAECTFALLPCPDFYNPQFLAELLDNKLSKRNVLTILPFKNQENSISLYGPLTIDEKLTLEENAQKLGEIVKFSEKTDGILLDTQIMANRSLLFLELTTRYLHYRRNNKDKFFLYPGELIEKTNINIADQLFIQERFEGKPLNFDMVIDENLSPNEIYGSLDKLRVIAHSKGQAVAIINDDNVMLACLLRWIEVISQNNDRKDVRLLGLTSISG